MDVGVGSEGYVLGRVMQLNTDALIVDPYVASDWLEPIENRIIETDKGELPLQDFYKPQ